MKHLIFPSGGSNNTLNKRSLCETANNLLRIIRVLRKFNQEIKSSIMNLEASWFNGNLCRKEGPS
jgi:hypothetical protein